MAVGYFEESAPDDFRTGRDDRVTQCSKTVHPSGNRVGNAPYAALPTISPRRKRGILPAIGHPRRFCVACQKSWQNLHNVCTFSGSLFAGAWSTWCAWRLVVCPHASHAGFLSLRARQCSVPFFTDARELAHVSEQYIRRRNEPRSSRRLPILLRSNGTEQVTQNFTGSFF